MEVPLTESDLFSEVGLLTEAWHVVRYAGVSIYAAWALLVFAIWHGRRAEKKDYAIIITVIAWYLTLCATTCGFIDAFSGSHSLTNVDIMYGITRALARLLPSLLLTIPAAWFILGGRRTSLVWGTRLLVVSLLVGLLDVILLAWAISLLMWWAGTCGMWG